jgi:hypothetical protein
MSFLKKEILFKFYFIAILTLLPFSNSFGSEVEGVIDGSYKYAWGENTGWINFGCDNCNVLIKDESLSGFAWSKNFGWINLNSENSGVKNDGEGNLSGFAWGSNIGWIDFDLVSIDGNGDFIGYAVLKSDSSQINFNCQNEDTCSLSSFKVKTDWKPKSLRYVPGGNSGGVLNYDYLINFSPLFQSLVSNINNGNYQNIKETEYPPKISTKEIIKEVTKENFFNLSEIPFNIINQLYFNNRTERLNDDFCPLNETPKVIKNNILSKSKLFLNSLYNSDMLSLLIRSNFIILWVILILLHVLHRIKHIIK